VFHLIWNLEVCLSAVQEDDNDDHNGDDNDNDVDNLDAGDMDQVESMALDSISRQTASPAFINDEDGFSDDASMPTATARRIKRKEPPAPTAGKDSKHTTFLQAFMKLDTHKLSAIQYLSTSRIDQGNGHPEAQPTIAGQGDQTRSSPAEIMASTASLHSFSSPTDRMLHYLTELHRLDRRAHHITIKTNWSYYHLGCAYIDFCKVRPLHPAYLSPIHLVRRHTEQTLTLSNDKQPIAVQQKQQVMGDQDRTNPFDRSLDRSARSFRTFCRRLNQRSPQETTSTRTQVLHGGRPLWDDRAERGTSSVGHTTR
jgi:hypothetical protein